MSKNAGFTYRRRVGDDGADVGLLAYLCLRYRHSSESEWLARIGAGDVRVDEAAAAPGLRLKRGQCVTWRRPGWDEPPAPLAFHLLYEDGDVLAAHKPAGLPTLPGAGFLHATLLHQVRLTAPGAAPLHRLGRFTSGVVLFAKTAPARAELSRQWRERTIAKRYRALAAGDPPWTSFTVDRPIGPVPHRLLGTVHAATPEGKPSTSRIEVIARRAGSFLCDVFIPSGRPHQIRIHLAAAGYPLTGDPLYAAGGLPIPGTDALPGDPGYLLHAAEIAFRHPRTQREVAVSATPPAELA